jgi:hypothetical protein
VIWSAKASGFVHHSLIFFLQQQSKGKKFVTAEQPWLNHQGQLEESKRKGGICPLMLSPLLHFQHVQLISFCWKWGCSDNFKC